MPELPEVETVVRGLRNPLVGRTFTEVMVLWARTIGAPAVSELCQKLPGQRIEAITRRGKYLQFQLSRGDTLFIHLKMSGNLWVELTSAPLHQHVRVAFSLDNGHQLRFKDTRKFGRIYLTDQPATVIGKLGPEPLADDFSIEKFMALFVKRRGTLKPLLLKQEFIAGIGNIYGDESCFLARLDPRRQAETLTKEELERLYQAIRQSLEAGIMFKGASFDAVYLGGQFQNHFQVYGRDNQPCLVCGTTIKRLILGGRSTHFCPHCQQ